VPAEPSKGAACTTPTKTERGKGGAKVGEDDLVGVFAPDENVFFRTHANDAGKRIP